MISYEFELLPDQLQKLLKEYPNMGKNSHVGNIAVKVVELFFKTRFSDATFNRGTNGADLVVHHSGNSEPFEIKGTVDRKISWTKLKVSSKACYNALTNGMTLIRVTNIGEQKMNLHFLKYGIDFELIPEPRWSVKPIK